MCRLAIFSVFLIFPILASAQSGCSSGGTSYVHLETFTHANGCAKLQCQNGTVATTYEACGKELDKKCHAVNAVFLFQSQTYICTKNSTGVYKIDLAPKSTCTAEGRVFQNLEFFKLSDGCNDYQCQDGEVAAIKPEACGKQLDGQCHLVDSWTLVSGKVYKCGKTVAAGKTTYSYTEIKPTPDPNTTCTLSSTKYTNLQIFKNRVDQCDTIQCQNGNLVFLNRACRFVQDKRKCYPLGQSWVFKGRVFKCVLQSGDAKVVRASPKLRTCTVGSTTYQDLETFTSGNGCETSQCQSGQVKVIESRCKDRTGQCVSLNHSWKAANVTFKCIFDVSWGYTIARVADATGPPVPVCENPGRDVIFLMDKSMSIGAQNFEKLKEFSAQLTRRFFIGTNKSNAEYLFGAVLFGSDVVKVFDLNTYLSDTPLFQALLKIIYTGGGTATHLGLDYIVNNNLFGTANGGRNDAENYLVVLTDGQSNSPPLTQTAAARVRSVAKIISVGIGSGVNTAELQGIAGNPANVFSIASFNVLDQVQNKLSERICRTP